MKKIFTSISLAAMSFMVTSPILAQSTNFTQETAVSNESVTTLLNEIKTVSGIDMAALLAGNSDIAFLTNSAAFAIHPDSASINLSSLMPPSVPLDFSNVKTTFSDYQKLRINVMNMPMEIELPGTIALNLLAGNDLIIKLSATAADTQGATLPIKKLTVDMEVGQMLAGILSNPALAGKVPNLKTGNVLEMSETVSNGISTVSTKVGENGITFAVMAGLMTQENPIALYETKTDLTKAQVEENKLVVIENWATSASGNRLIQKRDSLFDPFFTTTPMGADSIISREYDKGEVVKTTTTTNPYIHSVTSTDKKSSLDSYANVSIKEEGQDEVKFVSHALTTMNYGIDHTNLTLSAITNIMRDLATKKSGDIFVNEKYNSTTDESGNETKRTYLSKVTLETEFLKCIEDNKIDSLHATIKVLAPAPTSAEESVVDVADLTETMRFEVALVKNNGSVQIYLPVKGTKAGEAEAKPMATVHFQTNILGIATSNESIIPTSNVKVYVASEGIRVNGCEKATYAIVSMNGVKVANGIISGDGAYIATPTLQNGQIYIITIVENNGAVKSVKFQK